MVGGTVAGRGVSREVQQPQPARKGNHSGGTIQAGSRLCAARVYFRHHATPNPSHTFSGGSSMKVSVTWLVAAALLLTAAPTAAQPPKERTTLKGLTNNIDVLAVSSDGKLLVAGGSYGPGGELKLWDLTTGKERPGFKGANQ